MSDRPVVAHVLGSVGLGGVPEVAWQLISRLPAERFEQHVFVIRRAKGEDDSRATRQARLEAHGVPVSFATAHGSLRVVGELCDWLTATGVDLLHTHSYRPNLQGRLAGLPLHAGGLRLVAHYHSVPEDKWAEEGSLTLERHLTAATDRVVACSQVVADELGARLGVPAERVAVVPNAVEVERFAGARDASGRAGARERLGLDGGRPLVALVGRMSDEKGQADLVRAVPAVRAAHPGALFLLVGSTAREEEVAALRALAGELGVEDAVRFTGFVEDMPALYAAIDVLAAPSRWEGFGLMLAEAMAAGVPIVASTAGAIPEVVGDGPAELVPPRDAGALAAALTRVLGDAAARERMAAAGRERARVFSWERSARRLADVYDAVLA